MLHLLRLALLFLSCFGLAHAQNYPNKNVTLIVPFPAGGGTDTGARQLAQKLSELWGQAVIIENRGGAAGNIGLDYASKQNGDGYTLLMGNIGTQAINPSLYKNLSLDPQKAFKPISLVAELPLVLIANPKISAKSPSEFIAFLKSKPEGLDYGSSGHGSSMHLAAALFEDRTQTKLRHIPYKGGSPAIADVLGGHIHFAFATVLETIGQIKAGQLNAIAMSSAQRSPALPDVPTLSETALPSFDSISWIGLFAPVSTPDEIVAKIAADTRKVLENADLKDKLIAQGAIPKALSPQEFTRMIANDRARYADIIKAKNIVVE
jgi:tripartite-type tricarboxylate transporter receptor subunit TctC